MTDLRRAPGMHLHSSIPVVEVEGEWDELMGSSVAELVHRLAHAGHLEIIVNLTQMTRSVHLEGNWVEALEHIGATIHKRFGRLDIVGTVEQITQYVRNQAHSRLCWATSEEEAIGHIQGLPIFCRGPILTMRLAR